MGLHGFLQGYQGYADTQALGAALKALQAEGLDRLPLPGSGQTLERFSRLAQVAGHDLRLCKLFEGHTDALAIIVGLVVLFAISLTVFGLTFPISKPSLFIAGGVGGVMGTLTGMVLPQWRSSIPTSKR